LTLGWWNGSLNHTAQIGALAHLQEVDLSDQPGRGARAPQTDAQTRHVPLPSAAPCARGRPCAALTVGPPRPPRRSCEARGKGCTATRSVAALPWPSVHSTVWEGGKGGTRTPGTLWRLAPPPTHRVAPAVGCHSPTPRQGRLRPSIAASAGGPACAAHRTRVPTVLGRGCALQRCDGERHGYPPTPRTVPRVCVGGVPSGGSRPPPRRHGSRRAS